LLFEDGKKRGCGGKRKKKGGFGRLYRQLARFSTKARTIKSQLGAERRLGERIAQGFAILTREKGSLSRVKRKPMFGFAARQACDFVGTMTQS